MENKQAMVWRPCQQAQNLRKRNRDKDPERDTERQSFGCTRNGGGAGSEVTSEECRRRCKGMAPIHTCLRACTVIARYSSSEQHTTALSSLPSPPPPLLICLSLFFLLPQGTFLSAEEEEEKLLCLSRSRRTNPSALTSCCCCGPQRWKTVLDYCDGSRSPTEAHRDGSWILKKAAVAICFFFFFFWFVFSNQSLTLLQPSETREHEEQTQGECWEWNRERSLFFEHWIWVRGRIRTSEAHHQRVRDQEWSIITSKQADLYLYFLPLLSCKIFELFCSEERIASRVFSSLLPLLSSKIFLWALFQKKNFFKDLLSFSSSFFLQEAFISFGRRGLDWTGGENSVLSLCSDLNLICFSIFLWDSLGNQRPCFTYVL